jgi:BrnA antitoxin of type II toxin-antitoxin system
VCPQFLSVGEVAKQQVTLRLPRHVLDHFKAGGPGWQTRIGEALERHVGGASRVAEVGGAYRAEDVGAAPSARGRKRKT